MFAWSQNVNTFLVVAFVVIITKPTWGHTSTCVVIFLLLRSDKVVTPMSTVLCVDKTNLGLVFGLHDSFSTPRLSAVPRTSPSPKGRLFKSFLRQLKQQRALTSLSRLSVLKVRCLISWSTYCNFCHFRLQLSILMNTLATFSVIFFSSQAFTYFVFNLRFAYNLSDHLTSAATLLNLFCC